MRHGPVEHCPGDQSTKEGDNDPQAGGLVLFGCHGGSETGDDGDDRGGHKCSADDGGGARWKDEVKWREVYTRHGGSFPTRDQPESPSIHDMVTLIW